MKICSKCKKEKDLNSDNFYYRTKDKKWRNQCKVCQKAHCKEKYKQNSEIIKYKVKIYKNTHKEQRKLSIKNYNSKQEVKDRNRTWRQNNKKRVRETERLWKLKNPDKYKIISNRKHKKQRLKPFFKIRAHVSRQITSALRKFNKSKDGYSTLSFIPYSIKELKEHLESQFEPWMNWSNYGVYNSKIWKDDDASTWTWQIDHIIPQSDLPYLSINDDNFKICWSLNNLRPLNSKINVIEGSRRTRHRKL